MQKVFITLALPLALLLGSCLPSSEGERKVDISWADFVNLNDIEYTALYTASITHPDYIGEKVGSVQFKVDENITDSRYKTKSGDAAYLDEGTDLYSIKNMPDLIAVKNEYEVNGYRIYGAANREYNWHFKDITKSEMQKVEVQKGYTSPKVIKTFTEKEQIKDLMNLLELGERSKDLPTNVSEDPEIYWIVFYTNHSIAPYFPLYLESDDLYWHPSDREILPEKLLEYINGSDN